MEPKQGKTIFTFSVIFGHSVINYAIVYIEERGLWRTLAEAEDGTWITFCQGRDQCQPYASLVGAMLS